MSGARIECQTGCVLKKVCIPAHKRFLIGAKQEASPKRNNDGAKMIDRPTYFLFRGRKSEGVEFCVFVHLIVNKYN